MGVCAGARVAIRGRGHTSTGKWNREVERKVEKGVMREREKGKNGKCVMERGDAVAMHGHKINEMVRLFNRLA